MGGPLARAVLAGFRRDFHACLTARADELSELADAVLCAQGRSGAWRACRWRRSTAAATGRCMTRSITGGSRSPGCASRWGSLGKNDRLNIHWAAMQLRVSLVDYVIVHELAHIGQPRHTSAFWATIERAIPSHDLRRARLAHAGTTLWLG